MYKIKAQDMHKRYATSDVLKVGPLAAMAGDVFGIIGCSGSGKYIPAVYQGREEVSGSSKALPVNLHPECPWQFVVGSLQSVFRRPARLPA